MLYDDNINWSGQRRARELKARVKILKQRKKAGKSVPMSAAAQKSLRQRYQQFRHKECPKPKNHFVLKHTRGSVGGKTVKVKGYCRRDPARRGS
jgi:hypothetical protein